MSAHDYLVKLTEPLASPDSLRVSIFWSLVSPRLEVPLASPGLLHGAIFWALVLPILKVALSRDLDAFILAVRLLDARSADSVGLSEVQGIDEQVDMTRISLVNQPIERKLKTPIQDLNLVGAVAFDTNPTSDFELSSFSKWLISSSVPSAVKSSCAQSNKAMRRRT